MIRALSGLLLLLLCAACGSSTGDTPTTIIVSDGESNATPGQPTLTVEQGSSGSNPVTDCGEITVSGQPSRTVSDLALAAGSISCFAEAYKACHAATLSVRERDTQILRQFAILPNPNTPCDLRQALQTDPGAPPATADCAGLRAQDDGLLIQACSHLGDYLIPLSN